MIGLRDSHIWLGRATAAMLLIASAAGSSAVYAQSPFEPPVISPTEGWNTAPPQADDPAAMTPPAAPDPGPQVPDAQDPGAAQPGTAQPSAPAVAPGNMTVVPRSTAGPTGKGASPTAVPVQLVALLTADGQQIDQGLIWRVFKDTPGAADAGVLLGTHREAAPTVNLEPGSYIVNAAFGRAHLTRKISVASNAQPPVEQFVLNAGGLKVIPTVGGKPAPPGSVTYAIYADRDQTDTRKLIMAGAKPGLIIRLNAGLYHVVSTYGDTNAIVRSDVTVEAGKLTEASIVHTFARVVFKLVSRAGGDALPDTEWSIQTPDGTVVKESAGALPSHALAPGRYSVVAKHQGKAYRRDFTVTDGQTEQVEIVLR